MVLMSTCSNHAGICDGLLFRINDMYLLLQLAGTCQSHSGSILLFIGVPQSKPIYQSWPFHAVISAVDRCSVLYSGTNICGSKDATSHLTSLQLVSASISSSISESKQVCKQQATRNNLSVLLQILAVTSITGSNKPSYSCRTNSITAGWCKSKLFDRIKRDYPSYVSLPGPPSPLSLCRTHAGKYWAGLRASCEPVFHSSQLERYAPLMSNAAGKLNGRLRKVLAFV